MLTQVSQYRKKAILQSINHSSYAQGLVCLSAQVLYLHQILWSLD